MLREQTKNWTALLFGKHIQALYQGLAHLSMLLFLSGVFSTPLSL